MVESLGLIAFLDFFSFGDLLLLGVGIPPFRILAITVRRQQSNAITPIALTSRLAVKSLKN